MAQTRLDEPLKVQQESIKNEQMEQLISLRDELKIPKRLLSFIEKKYHVTRIEDLTETQAAGVIQALYVVKAKKGEKK